MPFRKILRYGVSVFVNKQEAEAVFVDLHVVAGTNPRAVRYFLFLIGVETARTQWPSDFVYVLC